MFRPFLAALPLLFFPLAAFADQDALVTIKLVKATDSPASVHTKIRFEENCGLCKSVDDPAYARENTREIVVAMRVPLSTPIRVLVRTEPKSIRRVLLEAVDLPFLSEADGISFTVPAQIEDRPNSGEFQTHLFWPGIELRFEHADPLRRAGDYATGQFPIAQREAAANLEFGLLQAIGSLGLDHYVDDQNLGRLWLMGFDTNFPHGHSDFPPHFHLALWLPAYRGTGSSMPHIYLGQDALITRTLVGRVGDSAPYQEYPRGKPIQVIDALGRAVFSLTVTVEGWLKLTRFDGQECSLIPIASGFDSGVRVACPASAPHTVRVTDDVHIGEIIEYIDGVPFRFFRYDPDSGQLMFGKQSSSAPKP